jgi:cytochrome oxidase Cu insertion factor (SCO1/SenC/PrrC family)
MAARPKLQHVLVAVLAGLLAAIAGFLLADRNSNGAPAAAVSKSPFDGPTMPPGLRAKNFSLVDQYGHRVTLSEYRGRVVVLTFIHSLCHDACPFMVEQIKGALNDLPNDGRGIPTIGVSVEPSQDTVHNRLAFLSRHAMTGRMSFVNGPTSAMRRVWHEYAIQPVSPRIDHSTFVLLIDKRGFERIGYAADQLTPEDLAHDIKVLERQKS